MVTNKRLMFVSIVIYALIQMVLTISVVTLQVDALNARKDAIAQRVALKKQNVYTICMLNAIWDTNPEDRTPVAKDKCKSQMETVK